MKKKSKNKKEVIKEIPEEVKELKEDVLESDIGAILNLTADRDNSVSDGLEFKKEENKDE